MRGCDVDGATVPRERRPHDVEKLLAGDDSRDPAAEVAGAGHSLCVSAGELAHQERAAVHAEPAADQIVVVEHEFPLLFERRIAGRLGAAEQRGRLGENPRLRNRLPGDHHAVDAALAEAADRRFRRVNIAVADDRHPRHASLYRGDRVPVGLALEELRGHAAVNGEARGAGLLDPLRHLDGGPTGIRAAEADFCRDRHAVAGLDHPAHDRAHAFRIAEQPRAAVGLLGDLSDRAAEVEIDHADPEVLRQPPADLREVVGVVVPHLHGERPRLVADAPEAVGVLAALVLEPDRAAGCDHLGGEQAGAAELSHHLPVREVGVARHRRLEDRRVDDDRADGEGGGL